MTLYANNAIETEQVSMLLQLRHATLKNQHWDRAKSQLRADEEGIELTDDHWAILVYLRKKYLETGLPRHARYLANELERQYTLRGGSKYLRRLFPGGPITQGSRLANLPTPPDAVDASHGVCY